MKTNGMKGVLAIVLAVSLAATGCSAQWISVALADLPVLVQMALNIATFTEAAQGKVISAADQAAIQTISSEASKDLNLLQQLYNEYKTNPSESGLQKITATIGVVQQNLPALLQAAHISDAVLAQKVTAGVGLILTTVESFAALIPQSSQASSANVHAQLAKKAAFAIPGPAELKVKWNVGCAGTRVVRFSDFFTTEEHGEALKKILPLRQACEGVGSASKSPSCRKEHDKGGAPSNANAASE